MGRKCFDPDFIELRDRIGTEQYRDLYRNVYTKTRNHGNVRYSGMRYTNSKERIAALKEKYKNGVPEGVINEMVGLKNGESTEKRR